MTVTDFQLHNLGQCSKIPIYYAMFGNFDGIENGGFHRLSAQCILDDSGPLSFNRLYYYIIIIGYTIISNLLFMARDCHSYIHISLIIH